MENELKELKRKSLERAYPISDIIKIILRAANEYCDWLPAYQNYFVMHLSKKTCKYIKSIGYGENVTANYSLQLKYFELIDNYINQLQQRCHLEELIIEYNMINGTLQFSINTTNGFIDNAIINFALNKCSAKCIEEFNFSFYNDIDRTYYEDEYLECSDFDDCFLKYIQDCGTDEDWVKHNNILEIKIF